ncbi:MAG: hypothetical protein J0H93_05515 [Chlamydiales bacterium]|nr:hypothetical protein [Chlamydiales bacterium]
MRLSESDANRVNNFNKNKIVLWLNSGFQNKPNSLNIECLRISVKSQVYKVTINKKRKIIFKCFKDEKNFLSEYLALKIFEREKSIAHVIDSCEDSRYLVMEYLPRQFSPNSISYLDQIAFNLGMLHAYGRSAYNLLNILFPNKTEKKLLESINELSWIKEKKYFEKALVLSIKYYDEKRVPLMIGDIKPEHVRLRKKEEIVFIDLETFSIGYPDYLDVLSLANFNVNQSTFTKDIWFYLLKKYLTGKNQCEPSQKEIDLNYEIVSLMAQSLGFHEFFKR